MTFLFLVGCCLVCVCVLRGRGKGWSVYGDISEWGEEGGMRGWITVSGGSWAHHNTWQGA